ncbi:MAG TPA: calcium/proton exchanger [Ktedonobacter sp.]|nr:calcium/proton exchanger [Ktedonobacter sp.]
MLSRYLYILLLAIPATLIAEALHTPPLVVFILAALGIVPLAGLIGQATEVLAERLGQNIGGLLNATFGNAAEIIIGIAALAAGLPDVVRASLAGSIIGNMLLVQGSAMLIGGWRYKRQQFNQQVAGQYAAMLALTVIGIAVPSLLTTVGEGTRPGAAVVQGNHLHQLSIGVAIILLLCYVAYIAFSVFGLHAHAEDVPSLVTRSSLTEETEASRKNEHMSLIKEQHKGSNIFANLALWWRTTLWLPIVVLAIVTAVTAVMSEALVGTIEPLTHQIGLNPFFVGLIILPIVGNAAEHFTAITSANHNHMEISMAITAGSSIQIALLATPILVLVGAFIGIPLDLNFSLLEVAMFGLVTILYALISLDGVSTWLEGMLLCAFYLILAIGSFFPPA